MSLQVFLVAFLVSFFGSIPPGTINVTTMQMSVLGHKRGAFFFSLAAALTEFVYAGATVRFQMLLSTNEKIMSSLPILTAIAMIVIGIANLRSHTSSATFTKHTEVRGRRGFRLGVVLGLVNPMTIPFWLAVTAYLQSNKWINLSGSAFWLYLSGLTLGTFLLLMVVRSMGRRFQQIADNQFLVHKLPGILFISLGAYNLISWLFS